MKTFYAHIKLQCDDGEVIDTVLQLKAANKQHAVSLAHEEVPGCVVIDVFAESEVMSK